MRILQVITDTDRRGAQVFACDLGEALERKGHSVTTVALAPGSQRPGLAVDTLGESRRGLATLRHLRRHMSEADITIAHGSATLLACAVAGRPFVYRQISDTRFWASGWRRRPRVAAYLRRAQHVVALSAGAATALHEHLWLSMSRITVVPNAVPTAGFHAVGDAERAEARAALGLATDEFVALYIGALVPEKGVDLAIRAIASTTNARLMVAGGGSQEPELQELAQRLGAPVTFLGVLRDARSAYRAADVNVLPSRGGDSMPATLIEAGMCGLPSIATPIGSIEDVVLHDRTGFIVPVDDVDAHTARLAELRDDPERRRQLGEAARAHCVANFDIDVVAAQWLQVLERVTKR